MLHSQPSGIISPGHTKRCQLLVSVRNRWEAEICQSAGVDWIDLKEPLAGSLGRPSLKVAQQVASLLENHSRRSVALGELSHLLARQNDWGSSVALSQLFPIAKVGLARTTEIPRWQDKLTQLLQSISGKLTPVIYADWQRCFAPEPKEIVQWAVAHESQYLLIDTFYKDGPRLLDCLDRQQLERIIETAGLAGTSVVLAGSLSMADVATLIELPCTALAVRGAVCSGQRHDQICPELLDRWVLALTDSKQIPQPNGRLLPTMS